MRIAWAFVTLCTLLMQWNDVAWYYSSQSFLQIFPDVLSLTVFPRFSLLHFVSDPTIVFALYLALLLSLFFVLFGFGKRWMIIVCIVLLHSFHHRNPLPMGGGDVLLYNIGFLFMVTPNVDGISLVRWFVFRLNRSGDQMKRMNEKQKTMPAWPYRLLLFQVILLYLSSFWWKLLGTMWVDGSAMEVVLRNPEFARFELYPNFIHAIAPAIGYGTPLWEAAWVLLLIPGWKHHDRTQRALIFSGILFHAGILLFLKVGSFSAALLVAYIGLWEEKKSTSTL